MSETEEILDDMGDREEEIELNNLPEELCIEFVDEYEEMSDDESTGDKSSNNLLCEDATELEPRQANQIIHTDNGLGKNEKNNLLVQANSNETTNVRSDKCSKCNVCFLSAAHYEAHVGACQGEVIHKDDCSVIQDLSVQPKSSTVNTTHANDESATKGNRVSMKARGKSSVTSTPVAAQQSKSVNNLSETYKCIKCKKKFLYFQNYDSHALTCQGENSPDNSVKESSGLQLKVERYGCMHCTQCFTTLEDLEVHINIHEQLQGVSQKAVSKIITTTDPFECELCGKSFSHKENLELHNKTHTQPGVFDSTLYGNQIGTIAIKKTCKRTEKRVKSHGSLKKKAIQRKRQSSFLNKKITSQSIVKGHMHRPKVMPNRNRRHTCSQCKVSFSRAYTLTCHMRKKHSRSNITVCNGGVQKHRSSVKRKNNRHRIAMVSKRPLQSGISEKFPHVCTDCNKSFTRPYTLKCHIVKFHSPVKGSVMSNMQTVDSQTHTTASVEKSGYNCEQCGKNFTRIFSLERHMYMQGHTNKQGKKPLISETDNNVGKMYSDRELSELFNCSRCVVKITRIPNLVKNDTTNEIFGDHDNQMGSERNKKSKNEIDIAAARCVVKITRIQNLQKDDTTNEILGNHDNQMGSKRNKNSKNETDIAAHPEITLIPNLQKYDATNESFGDHDNQRGSESNKNSKNEIDIAANSDDKLHECHLCSKKFSRADTLRDHIKAHEGIRPYCCDECSSCFKRADHLKRHKSMHRKRNKCLESGERHEELETHKNMQLDSLACGKKNKKSYRLSRSRKRSGQTKKPMFECKKCSKCFWRESTLENHAVNFHADAETPELNKPRIVCEEIEFSSERGNMQTDLTDGKKTENGDKVEKQNPKRSKSKRVSGVQFIEETKSKGTADEEDIECLLHQPTLEKDIAIQNGRELSDNSDNDAASTLSLPETFSCLECGERFPQLEALHAHQKVHTGNKLDTVDKPIVDNSDWVTSSRDIPNCFSCKECGERFTQITDLESHKNTHLHDLPPTVEKLGIEQPHQNAQISKFPSEEGDGFSCFECGAILASKEGLKKHIQLCTVNGELQRHRPKIRRQPFGCTIKQCNRKFAKKRAQQRHIAYHSTRPYSCGQCHRMCGSEKELEDHMPDHIGQPPCYKFQGLRPYCCDECSSCFKRADHLTRHKSMHRKRNKLLESVERLTTHEELETPKNMQLFTQKTDLEAHKNTHLHDLPPTVEKSGNEQPHQNAQINQFPSKEGDGFSCSECGAILASKEGLKKHIKLYTINGVLQKHRPKIRQHPFGCSIKQCSRKFATKREQQRHIVYHSTRPYSCSQCHMMFASKEKLEGHMPDHIGQPPCYKIQGQRRYPCEECGRSFREPKRLREHQTNRKKPCSQKVRCLQCGEWFIKVRDMVAHMKIHQTGTRKKYEIKERAYNCKECPESFSLAAHLKSHVTKFHPNAEIPNFSKKGSYKDECLCAECGKCFSTNFVLKLHLDVHHVKKNDEKKELLCSECGKCFSEEMYLNQHMKRHQAWEKKRLTTTKNLLECNECEKVFAFPHLLRDHIYSQHTGIKAEKCEQCGKVFASSKSLRSHIGYKHGVRGHWCPECGDSFTLKKMLHEHMKQHLVTEPSEVSLQSTQQTSNHKTNQEETSNAYICCQCGKGFVRSSVHRAHMKRVHTGETGHLCIVCGKNFNSGTRLLVHLKSAHSAMDLFYWCGECEERFTLKPDLERHLLQHGGNQSGTGHLLQHGGNQSGTGHLLQHCGNQSGTGHLLQHGGDLSEERLMQNAYAGLAMDDMEGIRENGEPFTQDAGDELKEMSEICPGCKKCFVSVADLEWHMKICRQKRLSEDVAKESSVPDLLKESNENGEALDFSNRLNAVDLGDTYQNQTESRENIQIDRVHDRSGELGTPENQIESDGDISEEDDVMDESNLGAPSPHFEDHLSPSSQPFENHLSPPAQPFENHLSPSSQPFENHLSPPAQPFENPDGDKHLQCGDTLINGNIGSYDSDTEIEDNISESNEDAACSTTQVYNCLECGASFSQNEDLQEHKLTHHEQDVLADQTGSIMENLTENSMEGSLILKLFTCLECGIKFTKREDLKDHKQIHANETFGSSIDNTQVKSEKIDSTSDIKYFRCEHKKCKKQLTERSAFNEHIQTHITETNRYLCTDCGKCYNEKRSLKFHMFEHTGASPYVFHCDKCGKQFHRRTQYYDTKKHTCLIRKQRTPKEIAALIQCALCDKRVQQIRMHMVAVHKGIKPFPCNLCERRCYTEKQLKVHMDGHIATAPSRYLCTECGKSYKAKHNLHFHLLSHKGVTFSCDKCEMRFATPDCLKKHMVKHTEGPILCEICGQEFFSRLRHTKHMRTHEDIKSEDHKKHLCEECGRGFSRKSYLAQHLLSHTDVRQHVCNICGKGYKSKSSLMTHMDSQHSNNPKKYSCKICDKICTTAALLWHHMKIHSGSKDHTCSICGKSFLFKQRLTNHMLVHSDSKPFSCPKCDKSFAVESRLTEHMLVHSELRPFSCSKCSKSYVSKSRLKAHLKVHSDNPFPCSICDKSFVLKSRLTRHLLTHTRPFSCAQCDKRYPLESQLNEHILDHSDLRPFPCTQCDKSFTLESRLTQHLLVHSEIKPFSCTKCDKSFVAKARLTQHLKFHGDFKPFSCSECHKSFFVKRLLNRHIKEKHIKEVRV